MPFIRSPSRSDEKVSLVRATPVRLRCCLWISSAIVCAKTRGLAAVPLYSFEKAAVWPATLYSRTWTTTPVAVLRTAPMTTPSAPSSRQRSNGTASIDAGTGIDA